jgi:DNA-binding NarL/FixJ family response regulator
MSHGNTNARAETHAIPSSLLTAGDKKTNSQMKAPQIKRKSKMKTSSKPVPVENPLASLGLTARETEVLTWIAQGKTNYEIGIILSACTGTICKHVERILCKLRVKNRTSAAAIAFAALTKAKSMNSSMPRAYRRAPSHLPLW